MKEILQKSQEVLASLTAKEAEVTARLAALSRRELDVQQREERNNATDSKWDILAVATEE